MSNARHGILRVLSDGVPRTISAITRDGGPHRSTIYQHLPHLERGGLVSSIDSGDATLYTLTDSGHCAADTSSRVTFAAAFPMGMVLAEFPEQGMVDFVQAGGIYRAQRSPTGWEIRRAVAYTIEVDDEEPEASLPPTLPLADVAAAFGRLA